jgi:hypothetical protein
MLVELRLSVSADEKVSRFRLSLPKMLSDANAFEISGIEDV